MESVLLKLKLHNCSLLKLLLFFFTAVLHHQPPPTATALLPKEALPTRSGYLKVNSTSGSSIFFAFYEAQQPLSPLSETPILIWLQGGPGCSSMLGNFYELGPWRVSSNVTVEPNPGPWNRIFGLLFIDNPIGVGFSFASSPEEIPRSQHDVAKHLFIAVKKFTKLDASYASRPIYASGESYAGKYIPGFGYYTLRKNARLPASGRLNLAGVAIGNGLTDPITQVGTHALSAYYSGLVNDKQRKALEELQKEAIELTERGDWSNATHARTKVLNTLQSMTGLATLYDFRRLIPYRDDLVGEFLKNSEVKRALGAKENVVFEVCSDVVGDALHEDVMKSVKFMVEYLVRNTRVLLYQGHCDLRDGVVSVEAWVKKMKWEGIGGFLEAERKVWKVKDELAGFVQKFGNLTQAVVLGAGHLVPTDQAVNSQAMMEDWVLEKGLFGDKSKEEKMHRMVNDV